VLAEQWGLPRFRRSGRSLATHGTRGDSSLVLFKPQTYMNRSGDAVRELLTAVPLDPATDLLVLVDDVALPLGSFRLRARGSAGGHNGLRSVEDALGSGDYARLRIGIGPVPSGFDDQADFVLADFARDELAVLADELPDLVDAVDCWLTDGIERAMNRFNRRGSTE
jgi:PTH1 family peptidyl-tRNA hydrolase